MDKQFNAYPIITSLALTLYFLVAPITLATQFAGWYAWAMLIYIVLIIIALGIEFVIMPAADNQLGLIQGVAGFVAVVLSLLPGVMIGGTLIEII